MDKLHIVIDLIQIALSTVVIILLLKNRKDD